MISQELRDAILSREKAQKAHMYLGRVRELFRAIQHDSTGTDFITAYDRRTMAQSLQHVLESEYGLSYVDSSYV